MQLSQALAKEYKETADRLINTYCQIKQNHPLEPFPRLTATIWRYLTLYWFWESVSLMRKTGQ